MKMIHLLKNIVIKNYGYIYIKIEPKNGQGGQKVREIQEVPKNNNITKNI